MEIRVLFFMELIKQNTQSQIIKSLLVIFFGSIILAISAKIKIPFYPVPMTMQTFVVLFLGISFGYKIAIATVGLYLIEGIAGIPVFSNSPERGVGLIYFTGPTMGYLIGFMSACFLASFITTKDNYFMILSKLILSVSTIYILGVVWLGILIGWDKPLVQLGVTPFLLAEFIKIALLTVLAKKLLKLRKFI
jgi:biotin transport system substrate-specific component